MVGYATYFTCHLLLVFLAAFGGDNQRPRRDALPRAPTIRWQRRRPIRGNETHMPLLDAPSFSRRDSDQEISSVLERCLQISPESAEMPTCRCRLQRHKSSAHDALMAAESGTPVRARAPAARRPPRTSWPRPLTTGFGEGRFKPARD